MRDWICSQCGEWHSDHPSIQREQDYKRARLAKVREMIRGCTAEDVMTLVSLEDEVASLRRELGE